MAFRHMAMNVVSSVVKSRLTTSQKSSCPPAAHTHPSVKSPEETRLRRRLARAPCSRYIATHAAEVPHRACCHQPSTSSLQIDCPRPPGIQKKRGSRFWAGEALPPQSRTRACSLFLRRLAQGVRPAASLLHGAILARPHVGPPRKPKALQKLRCPRVQVQVRLQAGLLLQQEVPEEGLGQPQEGVRDGA